MSCLMIDAGLLHNGQNVQLLGLQTQVTIFLQQFATTAFGRRPRKQLLETRRQCRDRVSEDNCYGVCKKEARTVHRLDAVALFSRTPPSFISAKSTLRAIRDGAKPPAASQAKPPPAPPSAPSQGTPSADSPPSAPPNPASRRRRRRRAGRAVPARRSARRGVMPPAVEIASSSGRGPSMAHGKMLHQPSSASGRAAPFHHQRRRHRRQAQLAQPVRQYSRPASSGPAAPQPPPPPHPASGPAPAPRLRAPRATRHRSRRPPARGPRR